MIEIVDCDQGSAEWYEARRGRPTASEFKSILAKGEGKMRKSYMLRLAAERLTEELLESYSNAYMDRGKAMEDEARGLYTFLATEPVARVGFIKNDVAGCSPDALIGEDGVLEIKTQRPDLLIDTLLDGRFPSEHRAQCQGALWITGRKWVDICVFWPKMPPLIRRAERDEAYIAELAAAVLEFDRDVAKTVDRIRNYGTPSTAVRDALAASVGAAA